MKPLMTAILIGGTPGTGKTETAKELRIILGQRVVALGQLAVETGCVEQRDSDRDTGIINEDCLVEQILSLLESESESIIIEGHYVDLVPSSSVKHVFILRTHPTKLKKRLRSRDYSDDKVSENVEAEIMGVCQMDALFAFGEEMVTEIDTTDITPSLVAQRIAETLKTPETSVSIERIDWMVLLEKEGILGEFLSE